MFRKIFFALLPSICVVPFLALSSCGNTIEKIVLQGGNFSDIRQDVNFDKSIKISVVSSYTVKNKIHYSINQNSDIECLNIYDNDDGTGTLVVRRSPVLTKTVIATLYAYDYSSNQFIKRSINILPNNYGYWLFPNNPLSNLRRFQGSSSLQGYLERMVANCDVIDRRTGQISNNRATYDLLTMKFTIKSDKGVEYSVIDPNDNPHHLFDIDFTTDLGMATFVGSNSVYAFNTGDFKNDPYVYCNFTAYYEYESYNFDFKFLIQVGA